MESVFHCPPAEAYIYGPAAEAGLLAAADTGGLSEAEAATVREGTPAAFLELVRRHGPAAETAAYAWFLSADVCVRRRGCGSGPDGSGPYAAAANERASEARGGPGLPGAREARGDSNGGSGSDGAADSEGPPGAAGEPACRRFAGLPLAEVLAYGVVAVLRRAAAEPDLAG